MCSGDKGTQTTGCREKSLPACSLRDTVWRDMGLPAAAENWDASCSAVSVLRRLAYCNSLWMTLRCIFSRYGNSRLSCISLLHTYSPPTYLIVEMVSSTHDFRLGYLGFRG
ncbi:hypothetical protein AVEN_210597-1, partial [Araneus ventricosus]